MCLTPFLYVNSRIKPQRDQSDKIFPLEYITSLAGRAVAETNKHPAPTKFRALDAPKMFDVWRKKKINETKINQLRLRLSSSDCTDEEEKNQIKCMLPINLSIGSSRSFVTDDLHFMRTIFPSEINFTVNNLYSIRANNESEEINDAQLIMDESIRRQREILASDDIIDDDLEEAKSLNRRIERSLHNRLPNEKKAPIVIVID